MKNTLCFTFIGHYPTHYIWIILLWSGFLVLIPSARGQYSLGPDSPCPIGNEVKLDTIFYTPDKAMPFERCFYLKMILPGKQNVSRFAITPINEDGKEHANRRDYHVFLKSSFPSLYPSIFKDDWSTVKRIVKKRKGFKKNDFTYHTFKDKPVHRIENEVHIVTKTTTTEVTLRVPPLEPNRDYHVNLIGVSNKVVDELVKIGELILSAQTIQPPYGSGLEAIARITHRQSVQSRNQGKSYFRPETYDEYQAYLTSFGISFAKKPDKVDEYRLLFVPAGDPAPTLADAALLGRVTIKPSLSEQSDTITKTIKLPIENTKYGKIKSFSAGSYKIYLYTFYNSQTIKSTIDELGNFTMTGQTYNFVPNPVLFTTLNAKFINGPMNELNVIMAKKNILSQLSPSPVLCLNQETFSIIMNQIFSCPCNEKGENTMVKKDDLTHTLSLLSENNSSVYKSCISGLISLKDPTAKAAKHDEFMQRLTNIQTSVNQINDLLEFARKAAAYDRVNAVAIRAVIDCLNQIKTELKPPSDALSDIIKLRTSVQDGFVQEMTPLEIIQKDNSFLGSTSMLDIVSDNKFRIVPDFGFIVPFTRGRSGFFQDFTPYLGFNVNFRSTDKNIPFRMIRYKSWKHYLSFMAGLTMRTLKIEGQREDFFDKSSLITGLGFRYNHWLRLTGGLVWFKAKDPNILSTATQVRASTSLGVSVDLDLQELFGGIKTLFK